MHVPAWYIALHRDGASTQRTIPFDQVYAPICIKLDQTIVVRSRGWLCSVEANTLAIPSAIAPLAC